MRSEGLSCSASPTVQDTSPRRVTLVAYDGVALISCDETALNFLSGYQGKKLYTGVRFGTSEMRRIFKVCLQHQRDANEHDVVSRKARGTEKTESRGHLARPRVSCVCIVVISSFSWC